MRVHAAGVVAVLSLVALSAEPALAQEDIGHKVVGTLGLDAGSQSAPGLYVVSLSLFYSSHQVVDQQGVSLPVGLNLHAFGEGVGAVGVIRLPKLATYINFALSLPFASLDLSAARPAIRIATVGIGDLYFQPLKFGWRWSRVDLVTGYGVYAPTGRLEVARQGTSVGGSQWTNELTAGGTIYFDAGRVWRASMLASYDLNSQKQSIAITLGDTLQIQGGVGAHFLDILDLGLAGYAALQTTGDSGSAVSPSARSDRDRAFGLGPELGIAVKPIRSRLTLRYEYDLGVRSGTVGQVLVLAFSVLATNPVSP